VLVAAVVHSPIPPTFPSPHEFIPCSPDGEVFPGTFEEYCPVPDIMDKCLREKSLPRKVPTRDGSVPVRGISDSYDSVKNRGDREFVALLQTRDTINMGGKTHARCL